MSWQVMLWNIGHNRKSPLSLGASLIAGERQTSNSKLAKSCRVPGFPPFFLRAKFLFHKWECFDLTKVANSRICFIANSSCGKGFALLFFNRTPWLFSGFNFERGLVHRVSKLRIFTGILLHKFGAWDQRSVMPRNSLNCTAIGLTPSKYGLFLPGRAPTMQGWRTWEYPRSLAFELPTAMPISRGRE